MTPLEILVRGIKIIDVIQQSIEIEEPAAIFFIFWNPSNQDYDLIPYHPKHLDECLAELTSTIAEEMKPLAITFSTLDCSMCLGFAYFNVPTPEEQFFVESVLYQVPESTKIQ